MKNVSIYVGTENTFDLVININIHVYTMRSILYSENVSARLGNEKHLKQFSPKCNHTTTNYAYCILACTWVCVSTQMIIVSLVWLDNLRRSYKMHVDFILFLFISIRFLIIIPLQLSFSLFLLFNIVATLHETTGRIFRLCN